MKRDPCTIIILPIVVHPRAYGVYERPDVLPANVVRFPGFWHRRGRSDDPLRKPRPSDEVA
jgi:hypothetical protein